MKMITSLAILLSTLNATYADTIIYEETTTVKKLTIIDGGMELPYGDISIASQYRPITKGRIKINDMVITEDNRSGTVVSVFPANNNIVVRDSYYGNRTWTLDKVAVTNGCINSICIGDNVVTSDNRQAVIKGYFANGKVVALDSYYGNRTWSQREVALAFGCTENFCVGDRVISSDNREGVVQAFFGNGKIVVRDSYYGNRTWAERELSITSGICTNIFTQRTNFCN